MYASRVVSAAVLAALAGGVAFGAMGVSVGLRHHEPAAVALAGACGVVGGAIAVVLARRWWRGDGPPASWGAVRVLLYAAFGAAASIVAGLVAIRHTYVAMSVAGAVGGVLILAGRRLLGRLPPRPVAIADIVFMNACVLVLAGELGLRALSTFIASPLLVNGRVEARRRIDGMRCAPGAIRFNFPCNSKGHYDTEFVPKTRDMPLLAITIGDSFSSGVVPHSHHFTTVCENELPGAVVYNMGVPATGPWEYLELLISEALPLAPDVVVIDLFVGNDANDAQYRATPDALSSWLEPQNLLFLRVPARLAAWAREARSRPEGAPAVGVPQGESETVFRFLTDPSKEEPGFSETAFRDMEVLRATNNCGPDLSAYDALAVAMDEIRRAAGSIPLVVMIIPDEFQVEDAVWSDVLAHAPPGVSLDRDRPQRRIREWCDSRRVPYIDLLPELRTVPPLADGRRHVYHLRDTHFNARGNRVAGEALARKLREYLGASK
ncbi:MAG TPA: SGNH/GDSL hydrolase family protein [Planctomycetota bacterium]|nr:SGNH/GDSL hydrolase family protein [Planctomycetota bacterium]